MVCGAGAGALHWACQRLGLGPAWRRTLVSLDLLDDPGAQQTPQAWLRHARDKACPCSTLEKKTLRLVDLAPSELCRTQFFHMQEVQRGLAHAIAEARRQLEAARVFQPRPEAELGWRGWLPIRQMTAEEWARHQAMKAAGGVRARYFPALSLKMRLLLYSVGTCL